MRVVLFLSLLLTTAFSWSQRTTGKLNVTGQVSGYEHNPKTGLFKKNDQIELQGVLGGVSIMVYDGSNRVIDKTTNSSGNFAFNLDLGNKYVLKYSKSGYGTSAIALDLRNIPEDLQKAGLILENLELVLNDFESDKPVDNGEIFGTISFNSTSNEFKFTPIVFEEKSSLFKRDEVNTPVNLIEKSILNNKNSNSNIEVVVNEDGTHKVTKKHGNNTNPEVTEELQESTEHIPTITLLDQRKIIAFKPFSSLNRDDLQNRQEEINNAWDALEADKLLAVTEEDFLLIKAREELLLAAEKELESAKAYIDEQEAKIAAQNNMLFLALGLILLLLVIGYLLYAGMRRKQRLNAELEKKNKKIEESIKYAERIQRSVLLSETQIAGMLNNAFVFHKPLDVVSGDFYWFSEKNDKVIFAAIDCTGHGVPGAFMSLIGNTLLNQIVNEKGITEPGKILSALHAGVVESLHQYGSGDEELADDGMDMALCTLDKKSHVLTFAGAMNPGFVVHNGKLIELDANIQGIGSTVRNRIKKEVNFDQKSLNLKSGDMVYLFSDGYMDQFGGTNSEKYNLTRFKELLVSISELKPNEQKAKLSEEFLSWKGNQKQIDDVLVVGTKI